MIAYIALFSALLSRLTAIACGSTWVTSFIARFLNIHRSGVLTALAWLVPHETAAVSAQVLCTPYNHAPCHFMQSHIHKVYACLAVTCHLHFWQNDRDLLRATAVTRGWNGYRNKSQHRKSTLEKKMRLSVHHLCPSKSDENSFQPKTCWCTNITAQSVCTDSLLANWSSNSQVSPAWIWSSQLASEEEFRRYRFGGSLFSEVHFFLSVFQHWT